MGAPILLLRVVRRFKCGPHLCLQLLVRLLQALVQARCPLDAGLGNPSVHNGGYYRTIQAQKGPPSAFE